MTIYGSNRPDDELLRATEAGDVEAYAQLFDRHQDAIARLAQQLVRSSEEVDELLDGLYVLLHQQIRAGEGPVTSFRVHALRTLRELATSANGPRHAEPTEDPAWTVLGRAFHTLPTPGQVALWHQDVDGETPEQVASFLGIDPEEVPGLCDTTRQELAQTFARRQLSATNAKRCRYAMARLETYDTDVLPAPEAAKVQLHREKCDRCEAVYADYAALAGPLAALLAPTVLGAYAPGYLRRDQIRRPGLFALGDRTKAALASSRRTLLVVGVASAAFVATIAWAASNLGTPETPPNASGSGNSGGGYADVASDDRFWVSTEPTPLTDRLTPIAADADATTPPRGQSPGSQPRATPSGPAPAAGHAPAQRRFPWTPDATTAGPTPTTPGATATGPRSPSGPGRKPTPPRTTSPGGQPTGTSSPTDTPTPTPTTTPTATETPTPTPTRTNTPTPTPTDTETPTPTPTATETPRPTPTPTDTETPTPTPTPTDTETPTPTPTPSDTAEPTPCPTEATPTPTPDNEDHC